MKLGMWGKAGAGTPELFAVITGRDPDDHRGQRIATVKVPDPRVDALAEIWKPKKSVYVEAQFVDLGAESQGNAAEGMAELSRCEGIIQVIGDLAALATDGPPDPVAEIQDFAAELLLRDQMVVEKRLERMAKANEHGPEREILERVLAQLEAGKPIRTLGLDEAQLAAVSGFAFVSALPLLVAINADEERAATPPTEAVLQATRDLGGQAVSLSVSIEAEIVQLDEADQRVFLDDLGLSESARARFLRAAYDLLELQTFLTMGDDECRAWSVRCGARAPQAGRRIHSDIERGFIRVEVIPFDDFTELKSEAACRKAGKMRVEGKDYLVQEGDILNFRFNV